MTAHSNALSLTLVGTPDLPGEVLRSMYRLTGRSTVELRHAIRAGEPVYVAALFGTDHLEVVPRLEKTVEYLHGLGIPFIIHEWFDRERDEISIDTMRAIVEAADGGLG